MHIDQAITYWVKKEGKDIKCCFGSNPCFVWILLEEDLIYTDSIRLYKEQNLVVPEYNIYPNPVLYFLKINANTEILTIIIFDALGVEILKRKVKNNELHLNLKKFSSGNYTIKLRFKNKILSHKFVKI